MNDLDFWNSIEATEDEKNRGSYYLRERGLEEHYNALKFIESLRKSAKRRIRYVEVATVLRYDKRIRRCLFKYIGVIEERLRAHLLDAFRDNVSSMNKTREFEKQESYHNGDFYKAVTHLTFYPLIKLFKAQNSLFKESVFGNIENLNINLDALAELRNQVYHNKFLLNNLEFKSCKYDGIEQASLYANIKNLYFFTEPSIRNGLVKDINSCSNYHLSKYKNQVNWKLPKEIIVSLDDVFEWTKK